MFRNFLLSCLLLVFTFGIDSRAYSQYADLGTGALKNQIWWFDWNGFTMANGATRTFTTSNNLTVTITFSKVSGPLLTPTVMNTWWGSVLHMLYNFSNASIKPALYHTSYQTQLTNFTLSLTATRNGVNIPVQFIAADAEASAITEITTLVTNGSNWGMIDFFRNSPQQTNPISGCNTKTVKITDTYGNAVAIGQNPVLGTKSPAAGPLVIDVSMDHSGIQGQMGLAFGIFEAVDRGDLPASYGFAQHQVQYAYQNECNYLAPLPSAVPSTTLRLGAVAGDPDGSQTGDDNTQGVDEDAFGVFPMYNGGGSYTLDVPVHNSTGSNAYLTGWFDIDQNGSFELSEARTVVVPNNATKASLSWTGLPTSLVTTNYAFRFRISSDQNAVAFVTGFARDGEVEDYSVLIPQSVTAAFLAPDTVCVNTQLTISNSSIRASTYFWSFCAPDLNSPPIGSNAGNISNLLSAPSSIDYVSEGGNFYGFVVNQSPTGLVRLNFGNSLQNTPTATNLGTIGGILPLNATGIQAVKSEGKWFLIAVGGNPAAGNASKIVRIDLGTNIANNAPSGFNWGNIGALAFPQDLAVFEDNGRWYGLTVNAQTNTITRFDFSNSFSNTPIGTNLGNLGNLSYPTGLHIQKNNSGWIMLVTNSTTNTLSKIEFAGTITNNPTGSNFGNVNNRLNTPTDICLIKSCDEIIGFVTNGLSNELVRLRFPSDFSTINSSVSLGNVGGLNSPTCLPKIIRSGSDLIGIITNTASNTVSRLSFPSCGNSSMSTTNLQNPASVTYNSPGQYIVNLMVDEGMPTQTSFCKNVTVVSNTASALQTKSICEGDSVLLSSSRGSQNTWNTGSSSNSIFVKTAGVYWVQSSVSGCLHTDSFLVVIKPLPTVSLGTDTTICSSDTLLLNAGNVGSTYQWQNGSTAQTLVAKQPGLYHVVVSQNGCVAKDSILISTMPSPVIALSADTAICKAESAILSASGGITYNWYPAVGLSSPNSAVTNVLPDSTTKYYVTVTNASNCQSKDSVIVTVVERPVVNLGPDKNLCSLDSVLLDAGNAGDHFIWQNGQTSQSLIVTDGGFFHVAVNRNGCIARDSILITEIPSPVITVTGDTTICKDGQAQLSGNGGSTYQWLPTTGLTSNISQNTIASPAATTTYHLIVTSANNCTATDSITVTVNPKPVFSISSSKPILCLGDTTLLSAVGGERYTWFPATALSNPNSNTTLAYPSTSTAFEVIIENDDCRLVDTLSVNVPVAEKPNTSVSKTNDITCFLPQAKLLAQGGLQYAWQPTAGLSDPRISSPSVSINATTLYTVTITTAEGCVVTDTITVNVDGIGDGKGFLVPSAFTPNNDGKNDCFGVPHWGEVKDFSLNVYNRWGEIVFHADRPSQCWNGIYKGVLQPNAVFVYLIKAKTLCGEVFKKGTITLIR